MIKPRLVEASKDNLKDSNWILEGPMMKKANSFGNDDPRLSELVIDSSDSSDREQVNSYMESVTPRRVDPDLSFAHIRSEQQTENVTSLNLGEFLKMGVAFSGQNIDKQIQRLVAFARTILEKPKLILMYEDAINCGSGVAYNIDALKTKCPESTVMSITRSNRNILSYDQIILMDGGMIIDQGDPAELISQTQSHFYNYLKETDHEAFFLLKRQLELKPKHDSKNINPSL